MIRKFISQLLILLTCLNLGMAQGGEGKWSITGTITMTGTNVSSLGAQLPITWVDAHQCDPPGGTYDVDHTLSGNGDVGIANLLAEYAAWVAGPDEWYRVKVPAGTLLNSSTYDGNNSLISFGAKAGTVTKCFVMESTTPLSRTQIACAHGLPGYGGVRNPGCSTDVGKMWTVRQDDNPAHINFSGIWMGIGTTHIAMKDFESTVLIGSDQDTTASKGRKLVNIQGADHIIFLSYYLHGWNPGDPGQPAGACGAPGSGQGWDMTGQVTTSAGSTTVTWINSANSVTGAKRQFGLWAADATHSPGYPQATIKINGVNYTVSNHDPAVSQTVLTIATGAASTGTFDYEIINPATVYANGCGDAVANGIDFECDNCAREWGYIEKIHTVGVETHASLQGFNAGPTKIAHNWEEAGSCGYFSGGAAVDTRSGGAGPVNDLEIRGNYFGRDLAWRQLSAQSGGSPHPPFGCGPLDKSSAHDTCPFNWAIKNTLELKLGRRVLLVGNIIENNWADGQDGSNPVISVRTISGGATAGVFFPATGLPRTVIDNLYMASNWIRNSDQGPGLSTRSGSPGNGGGVSAPIQNVDILNNAMTNIGDPNQWGTGGSDLMSWGGISNQFVCTMTRNSGVAHAVCKVGTFGTSDHSVTISSAIRAGGTTTIKFNGERHDPVIGGQVTVGGGTALDGTFTINGAITGSSTAQWCTGVFAPHTQCPCVGGDSCVNSNGTFGDGLTFADARGDVVLCTTGPTCTSAGITLSSDTLAYSITDISTGDAVHATVAGCPGGANCSCSGGNNPVGYGASASTAQGITYAIAPTQPNSLEIFYPSVDVANDPDASGTVCAIDNGSGFPKNASAINNDFVSANAVTIHSKGVNVVWQHINNNFFNNIFAMTGTPADVICQSSGIAEGTASLACWDQLTLSFFGNVLQGRDHTIWPLALPVSGASNLFPTTSDCGIGGPTADCLGWQGYINGNLFPTSNCAFSGDPTNCPLMALPWSTNFTLSKLKLCTVATCGTDSIYLGKGIDVPTIEAAFVATIFVCPLGKYCGPHGPYLD